MSDLITARADLKAHLDAELTNVTVYDHPADSIALPAIVFVPGSPYWVIDTMGKPNTGNLMVNLDLQFLFQRATVDQTIGKLEAVGVAVALAITTADQPWRFVEMGSMEQVTVEGQEVILTTMAIMTRL